jgi:hypothetical protein
MREKVDLKEWAEDFNSFISAPEVRPPSHVQEKVFRNVHHDLNPSLSLVFSKLAGLHVIGGSLSLALCSQFGIGRGYNVMHVFMNFGELACMMLCGAIFFGLTVFMAGFFLSRPELVKIRKTYYAPILLLGVASIAVFLFFGAEFALSLTIFWLVGAVLVGASGTELILAARKQIHTR